MILDTISICLLVCLLIVVLLLHRQMLNRFNAMGRIQQRIFKRFDSFLEKVQVQSINQDDQIQPHEPDETLDITDGDWKTQFADGFVRYLKDHESPLMDPEVFMGEGAQGYPAYIGFNIRRLENQNIQDPDAFWLVASTAHDRKIYLKLHMNNSEHFKELKSQKAAIERTFGDPLKWESQGQYFRIGVDISVNPLNNNKAQWNRHFEDMRKNLEKLGETFQPRIEKIFSEDDFIFLRKEIREKSCPNHS